MKNREHHIKILLGGNLHGAWDVRHQEIASAIRKELERIAEPMKGRQ